MHMAFAMSKINNWPLETLRLQPTSRAPRAYGPGVWRFAERLTLSVLLPKRGWQLLKKTKTHVYLRPPAPDALPPFEISIAIPTKEQFIAIAREQYVRGESWKGQLGEWPAWYIHNQVTKITEVLVVDRVGVRLPNTTTSLPPVSYFHLGESGVWYAEMHWSEAGERYSDSRKVVVSQPVARDLSVDDVPPLFEGRAFSVELSSYERNPEARRRCLAHFGSSCQVCGCDFERTYGPLGRGHIHVHHRVPLSEIGAEYVVDPVRDLIPVCPNCHTMIHLRQPPYTIEELRAMLQR
jgi:hypothetical protein